MRDTEKEIRNAFMEKAVRPRTTDIVLLEQVADGIVAALKKYDEIALEVRRTRKPPQ